MNKSRRDRGSKKITNIKFVFAMKTLVRSKELEKMYFIAVEIKVVNMNQN